MRALTSPTPQEPALILVVTNRFDPTADHVLLELTARSEETVRFNTEEVPTKAGLALRLGTGGVEGHIEVDGRSVELEEISSVWYRRPAQPEPSEEITDPDDRRFAAEESEEALLGLWRALDCTWVSHPDALEAASYKPAQLLTAAKLGFAVPRTLITAKPQEARAFVEMIYGDVIIKPLRYGVLRETDEYEDVVFANPVRTEDVRSGMEAVALCPCFLQEYIDKDVEIRVTVVGKEVFSAEIHSQEVAGAEHDWRRSSAADVPHLPHALPNTITDRCVGLVRQLGLNFGAIDLIRTPDGRYVFLEINPNGQWLWVETLTGLPITDSLVRLLTGEAEGLR